MAEARTRYSDVGAIDAPFFQRDFKSRTSSDCRVPPSVATNGASGSNRTGTRERQEDTSWWRARWLEQSATRLVSPSPRRSSARVGSSPRLRAPMKDRSGRARRSATRTPDHGNLAPSFRSGRPDLEDSLLGSPGVLTYVHATSGHASVGKYVAHSSAVNPLWTRVRAR